MKYNISSRIIHWLMAAIIIGMIGLGFYMDEFLAKDAPNRFEIYNLHKSIGVMVLILIFVRVANRFIYKAPALPQSLPKIEKIISHFTHIALYLLMILVPFSGYLMSNSYGYAVNFFTIKMPDLITKNPEAGKIFSETHEISAYLLLAFVSLHILGALKHRFFDKPENDVLKRMI